MSNEQRERAVPVFPVRDVRAALAHYEKLGFRVDAYEEAGTTQPVYGFGCLGNAELHFARVPDLDPQKSMSACYLYVPDANALHATWLQARVPGRLTAPEDTPYGLREFAHVDPDGNLVRVGSPLPASKPTTS
jgi:catechol 2,3-dioxygenase-like lactoylglutathione lyase family enzyme